MAPNNFISVNFTGEELQKIDDALNAIISVIQPKAVNLTPDERRQYGRIADKNKILVDKCKAYMEQEPSTIPPTLDKTEFDKDHEARAQIENTLRKVARIEEMLRDTKTLLDYDNFSDSISYYRYIKYLAGENKAGSTSIFQDLNQHYKSKGKKSEEKPSYPEDNDPTS